MSNSQYPASALVQTVLPLCSGYIVQKFMMEEGFREQEIIFNESGARSNDNLIDGMVKYDIELIPLAATTPSSYPTRGSTVTFTSCPTWVTQATSGTVALYVDSNVKPTTAAGKVIRLSFTAFKNSNIP